MKSRAPCAVFNASIGSFLGWVPSARPGGGGGCDDPSGRSSPSAPPRRLPRRRRQQQRGGPRSEPKQEEGAAAAATGPPSRPSSSAARPSHADMGQGKGAALGPPETPAAEVPGPRLPAALSPGRGIRTPVTAPRPLPPAAAAAAAPRPALRSAPRRSGRLNRCRPWWPRAGGGAERSEAERRAAGRGGSAQARR